MLTPGKYARKPFQIEAVFVTEEKMMEVATWCGGIVIYNTSVQVAPHIDVPVQGALTERQSMAFAGDWVLKMGNSFKVYTDKAFQKCFEPVE